MRKLKMPAILFAIVLVVAAMTAVFSGVALGDDQHNHYGYLSNANGYGAPDDDGTCDGICDGDNMFGQQ